MKNKEKIIDGLLRNKIVKINPKESFQFASGIKSPIYTDLRETISFPKLRKLIENGLAQLITNNFPDASVVAGVSTAGIPHAAYVSAKLDWPMIYVRPKPKNHGTGKQIEGKIRKDNPVIMIDDLVSTGESVIKAAQGVQKAGYTVSGVISIFSYGFPDADKNFKDAKLKFLPLINYVDLLVQMKQDGDISKGAFEQLKTWHKNPWEWD